MAHGTRETTLTSTIDDTYLEEIARSLRSLAISYYDNAKSMNQIADTFDSIQLESGSPKIDEATGQVMTEARRQEVYDKCLPEAKRLLNITDEEEDDENDNSD